MIRKVVCKWTVFFTDSEQGYTTNLFPNFWKRSDVNAHYYQDIKAFFMPSLTHHSKGWNLLWVVTSKMLRFDWYKVICNISRPTNLWTLKLTVWEGRVGITPPTLGCAVDKNSLASDQSSPVCCFISPK